VPLGRSYGGLIFACWDAGAMSLDDYLGEARWYLDNYLLVDFIGGLEVIPGTHKYRLPVNWKILADNFGGDGYHFSVTHASVLKLLARSQAASKLSSGQGSPQARGKEFAVSLNHLTGVPHGIFQVVLGPT